MGEKAADYAAQRERKLILATVAFAQPGEMQPERDFSFQGEGLEQIETHRIMGRAYRRTSRWLSFDMPVDAAHLRRPGRRPEDRRTDDRARRHPTHGNETGAIFGVRTIRADAAR